MSIQEKKSFPAIPAVLLSMISVQSGASIAKRLFPVLGPGGTSSLRIGLSAIILFIVYKPDIRKLTKVQWFHCIGYGLSLAIMNLVFYYAIQRIPLGLGVTIEFIGPLALALFLSRKILDVFWALLACLGIMLIVPWKNDGVDLIGLLLAFTAGIFWAGYIVLGGKISRIMKNGDAVTVGMGVATLFILPFGILSGDLEPLTIKYLIMGLGVALLSSAVPFSLDLIALKKLPSRTFSVLMSLQPAFGALAGLIFLKENLTLNQWISIFCVVIASIGVTLSTKKKV
mgnify:CR=1 FL=1